MSPNPAQAREAFAARFDFGPDVVAIAPGRVNLIGEHTDYNDGFVLPMAIARATVVAARRRDDAVLRACAVNLGREVTLSLDHPLARQPTDPWVDYVLGVLAQWRTIGHTAPGMDMLIAGDVPIGCGLSSSASLTMAVLRAVEHLSNTEIDGIEAALLGQRVENVFLGLSCGIMDPFVIRNAREGHALLLDCRSRAFEHIPVALEGYAFVIANTGVTRGLTASKYNERVAECREAVRTLCTTSGKSGTHLRDFTLDDLKAAQNAMEPITFCRARHVITENARTIEAAAALRAGDASAFGALMDASHASLRDDYAVSCDELDAVVTIGRAHPACLGARMTGAGFGGCAVLLVRRDAVEPFTEELLAEYHRAMGIRGEVIVSGPAAGAGVLH